jgi:hypothetical protein
VRPAPHDTGPGPSVVMVMVPRVQPTGVPYPITRSCSFTSLWRVIMEPEGTHLFVITEGVLLRPTGSDIDVHIRAPVLRADPDPVLPVVTVTGAPAVAAVFLVDIYLAFAADVLYRSSSTYSDRSHRRTWGPHSPRR